MKSIINEIYYGNLSGYDIEVPKQNDKDMNFYQELNKRLSEEDLTLLNNLINEMSERYALDKCECYKLGFKTGFSLAFEIAEKEEL